MITHDDRHDSQLMQFLSFILGSWFEKLFRGRAALDRILKENDQLRRAVNESSAEAKAMTDAHGRAQREIVKLQEKLTKLKEGSDRKNELLLEATQTINRLRALASADPLTGVFNRRGINDALQREASLISHTLQRIEEQFPDAVVEMPAMSVIFFDLDNFKRLNDEMKLHEEGDKALVAFAKVLREVFPRDSDIIGRTGGDEFIVILPNTDIEKAVERAEQVRRSVEADPGFLFDNGNLRITTSIGVAKVRIEIGKLEVQQAIDQAIADADGAVYVSKGRGRNCVTKAVELERLEQ